MPTNHERQIEAFKQLRNWIRAMTQTSSDHSAERLLRELAPELAGELERTEAPAAPTS